jgi:hypothetical protein
MAYMPKYIMILAEFEKANSYLQILSENLEGNSAFKDGIQQREGA